MEGGYIKSMHHNTSRTLQLAGCLAVFGSAFCFYLATAAVKWSKAAGLEIAPAFFVFSRFLAGFISVCIVMAVLKKRPTPRNYHFLMGRTLANCLAVYCFFKGVDLTSVAEANILNMTYPLFIAIISWTVLKQHRDPVSIMIVAVAFAGVWLILSPEKMGLKLESLWALGSGISAAVAIIYLNLCRREHDTETILFFLFGLGGLIIAVLFHDTLTVPDRGILKYIGLSALFSVAGQYLITIGFRYVTALEGGIISSTRILIAAVLGPFIALDPYLSVYGWIGALLIFGGNVYLTLKKVHA